MAKGSNRNVIIAEQLLEHLGGAANVVTSGHCMTRLRVTPQDRSKVNMEAIKKTEGVLGVVEEETIQIILGPGAVNKVSAEFDKLLAASGDFDLKDAAAKNKSEIDKKNAKPFKLFLRRIASIFIPLIPALVAS